MSRNELCPCGSGKKQKKCCGAPGKQAAKQTAAGAVESSAPVIPAQAALEQLPNLPGLFTRGERAVSAERAEEERKKHLRRRSESKELRGSLVYNSGSAFRRRTP